MYDSKTSSILKHTTKQRGTVTSPRVPRETFGQKNKLQHLNPSPISWGHSHRMLWTVSADMQEMQMLVLINYVKWFKMQTSETPISYILKQISKIFEYLCSIPSVHWYRYKKVLLISNPEHQFLGDATQLDSPPSWVTEGTGACFSE